MSASRLTKGAVGETDSATLNLDFKNAHCLMHAEVQLLLKEVESRRVEEASVMSVPPPSKAFLETIEYVNEFGQYSNRELIRSVRQILTNGGLHEFETAQLANLAPSTAEEAKQLVPSLSKTIEDNDLQRLLDDLSTARRYEI